MSKHLSRFLCSALLLTTTTALAAEPDKLRLLIIDGENNHDSASHDADPQASAREERSFHGRCGHDAAKAEIAAGAKGRQRRRDRSLKEELSSTPTPTPSTGRRSSLPT